MAMENGGGGKAGDAAAVEGATVSIESRPGILLIGAPNVGKRTLLSRLISIEFTDSSDLSTGILCQGWTIETKYYTADLSIWITHLHEGFSFGTLPIHKQLDALVMVFDMNDEASFFALQDWVARTDIKKFEILLCIGNKADLLTGHHAHMEYRRRMQKHGESNSDPHPEYIDYGIDETEGSSLLGHEETSFEIRKLCVDWCTQQNIEYIEACASNSDFDKCLSTDGDIQGVDRLFGALSAHMWPGMILKSGNNITIPSLIEAEASNMICFFNNNNTTTTKPYPTRWGWIYDLLLQYLDFQMTQILRLNMKFCLMVLAKSGREMVKQVQVGRLMS